MYFHGDDLNDLTTLGFYQRFELFLNKWQLAKVEAFEVPYPMGSCVVDNVESLKHVLPTDSSYIYQNPFLSRASQKVIDNAWDEKRSRLFDQEMSSISKHANLERYSVYFRYVMIRDAIQSRLDDSPPSQLRKSAILHAVASWLGMDDRYLWDILRKVGAEGAD